MSFNKRLGRNRRGRLTVTAAGLLVLGAVMAVMAGKASESMACDAVPEKYRALKNPVAELSERKVKYWAKQYKAKCARCHGEDGSGA